MLIVRGTYIFCIFDPAQYSVDCYNVIAAEQVKKYSFCDTVDVSAMQIFHILFIGKPRIVSV